MARITKEKLQAEVERLKGAVAEAEARALSWAEVATQAKRETEVAHQLLEIERDYSRKVTAIVTSKPATTEPEEVAHV